MRIANIIVTGVLGTAVVAEGAYIIKTQRQVETLSNQVQQLSAEALEESVRPVPVSTGGSRVGERPTQEGGPPRVPPPRFTLPAADPASARAPAAPGSPPPLPAVIDTPEARDQLRNFIAVEMQTQRDNMREQQRQARDEEAQRRMDAAIKSLGVSPEQGAKVAQLMAQADDSRRQLREKMQSGQVSRADIGREMAALREQTDKQLKDVVGEEKAQKFQELRRQNGMGGGGPWGGPRGGGFGGPPPPPQ